MKILYVVEKISGIGGMERILTDKMNWLVEHTDYGVVLLLLWKDDKPVQYALDSRINVLKLDAPFGISLIGYPLLWWRFTGIIKGIDPDITIYTGLAGAFLVCFGGWKGKSIFECHGPWQRKMHRILLGRTTKKVDCVVTLTSEEAKIFPTARRVAVIPDFTNIEAKDMDYESQRCLWMGRFSEEKDLPRLIRLWEKISLSHPGWILDIVGDGPLIGELLKLIYDEKSAGNVSLHPPTDDVALWYSQSSIYLLTSRFEGFSMVLIEAQACGLPAIAFDCDYGPRHIIEDGKTGYLIPYDDDTAFTSRLNELMDSPDLRRKMGDAAKASSMRFRPEHIMPMWTDLFSGIRPSHRKTPHESSNSSLAGKQIAEK